MPQQLSATYAEKAQVQALRDHFGSRAKAAPAIIKLLQPVIDQQLEKHQINETAFITFVIALRNTRKKNDLQKYVNHAYEIAPNSLRIAREKINLLTVEKKYKAAHHVIAKLAENTEHRGEAVLEESKLLLEEGNKTKAIKTLNAALKDQSFQPFHEEFRSLLKAFKEKRKFTKSTLNTSEAAQKAATIATDRKGREKALKYLLNLMQEEHERPIALLERAASYALGAGQNTQALTLANEALFSEETRQHPLSIKALSLLRLDRGKEAFQVAQTLYQINEKNDKGAFIYAAGLAAQGKYQDMLEIITPFLDDMESDEQVAASHHFLALKVALTRSGEEETVIRKLTRNRKTIDLVKSTAQKYRYILQQTENERAKLNALYKVSTFWQDMPEHGVNRNALNVAPKRWWHFNS